MKMKASVAGLALAMVAGLIAPTLQASGSKPIDVTLYMVENAAAGDCDKFVPVKRSVPGIKHATPEIALKQLLAGPNEAEEKRYSSMFSADTATMLRSAVMKGSSLFVNLDGRVTAKHGNMGTSCGRSMFFGQVETTVNQFRGVKTIYYAIDGKSADFADFFEIEDTCRAPACRKSDFK